MAYEHRLMKLLCWELCAAVIFGMAGACSPEHYKVQADEEVYKIIDNKWESSFGQKANYKISDVTPSPNDIQIDKAVLSSSVITLTQAVAMATAHNRQYQNQKEELYLVALGLTGERHKYARQWFGTVDGEYSREGDDEDVSIDAEGGFDHTQLLADGVIVSTGLAIDWVRFLTGDPRTELSSVLSASLTAPLLGAGAGKIEQEKLTQAEWIVLYRIRSFNRYRKTFVVSIVSDYYGVLQQRDKVTNAKNDYERRIESKERLEMEAKAGRRNRFEVDLAEQDLLTAKDNYVGAQQSYEQKLDEFKIRMSLPTDANVELDQDELKALENIGISKLDYTLDAAIETSLLRRLDLANSMDAIDDSVRKVILAADGLGPQLNLTGSIEVNSREKTDVSQLQFHEGIYQGGFDVDLPFDRKAERNAYRTALINLERSQRTYENNMDNVKLSVRQAYRQLQESAERYHIQKNSLDLAEKRVESTTLLLEAGRLTTRDLLESQDALLEAQNNVTTALVGHVIARLSFFRDVGILQVRPDGTWMR